MISRQDCNKCLIYSSGDANVDARLVLLGCMCHHTDNKITCKRIREATAFKRIKSLPNKIPRAKVVLILTIKEVDDFAFILKTKFYLSSDY
jgi:hypothetical protein